MIVLGVMQWSLLDENSNLIAKKIENDLVVLLKEDISITFDDYFDICTPNLFCIVNLPGKDNVQHAVEGKYTTLADGSQIVYFYGNETDLLSILENQSSEFMLGFKEFLEGSGYDFPQSAMLLPLLALGGGTVAVIAAVVVVVILVTH